MMVAQIRKETDSLLEVQIKTMVDHSHRDKIRSNVDPDSHQDAPLRILNSWVIWKKAKSRSCPESLLKVLEKVKLE